MSTGVSEEWRSKGRGNVQKIVAGLLLGLGFVSSVSAGAPGFSTIRVNWSGLGAGATQTGLKQPEKRHQAALLTVLS